MSSLEPGEFRVGDLVRDQLGRRRVVTDIRKGQPILRPVHQMTEEPVRDTAGLTLIARRGEWR